MRYYQLHENSLSNLPLFFETISSMIMEAVLSFIEYVKNYFFNQYANTYQEY